MSRAEKTPDSTSSQHTIVETAGVERRAQFAAIVSLSRTMRERVHAGAWDAIVAMETERQAMLNAFFSVAPAKSEAKWIAESIQEMLQINNEMEDACRKHLTEISSDMQHLNARR